MPRETATKISDIVRGAVLKIYGKSVKVETCGSYRRGRPTCGDVDILITRTDNKPVAGMLEPILLTLEEDGFLHERLGNTRKSDKGSEMYMGVCKAPKDSCFRRIDIKVYPKGQYGFALLYFTGSDIFNRSMR
jgi:DNA polymerase lambda